MIEATKYNVLPLDDRFAERVIPEVAGRPTLVRGNRQLLFGGMGRLAKSAIVDFKNKSYAVTAEVVVPDGRADGVIVAVGGNVGGWSLYVKDGKPKYCYNYFGLRHDYIVGDHELTPWVHRVRIEFAHDGSGLGKGGNVTLYVDGVQAGAGRVEATEPFVFSADETLEIGHESGAPVTTDYSTRTFIGDVNWVEIDIGDAAEDLDHLITPEERLTIAMAVQ